MLVAAGVLLRAWILASPLGAMDSDEAVVGLMARHILEGEFPVFYWGQSYGGAAESYLAAGVFALVGSSTVALRVVPLLLYAGGTVLMWRIGRRIVGEPRAAIGAAIFWIAPAYFVWHGAKTHGFYGAVLVLGLAIMLIVLRLRENPDSKKDLVGLGLMLGLGWWNSAQIVLVAAPALIWLAVRVPRSLRHAGLVVPAALIGAAPWLIWNLSNEWASLHIELPRPDNSYLSHLPVFFLYALPAALNLRVPGSHEWLLGVLPSALLYVAALCGFAVLVVRRPHRLEVLLATAVAFPFLFSLSPWGWYQEPRYLLLLAPIIVLLLVRLLTSRPLQIGGSCLALVLTVAILAAMSPEGRSQPSDPGVQVSADLSPLIAALHQEDIDAVYANYWIAYRLTFESEETIIATSPGHVRYQPYDEIVQRDPGAATVMIKGSEREQDSRDSQEYSPGNFWRHEAGDFVIYEPHP